MGVCFTRQKTGQKYDLETLCKLPRFLPRITKGIVTNVYDGDTITVAAPLGGEWYRFSVRVKGVDTPELRSKCAKERDEAIVSRNYTRSACLHKHVVLTSHTKEKYGRVCANVILPSGRNLASLLIAHGFGTPYDGGRKSVWRPRAALN